MKPNKPGPEHRPGLDLAVEVAETFMRADLANAQALKGEDQDRAHNCSIRMGQLVAHLKLLMRQAGDEQTAG